MDNPQLTPESLLSIKYRIENDTAESSDYEQLDYFLSAINLSGYILKNMRERGFPNYKIYIERKRANYHSSPYVPAKDHLNIGFIYGIIKECISLLQRLIKA